MLHRVSPWVWPVLLLLVIAAVSAFWANVVVLTSIGAACSFLLGIGITVSDARPSSGSNLMPTAKKTPSKALGKRTNLSGALLSGAILTNADLRYADLRGADLANADLRGANLANAALTPLEEDPPADGRDRS